MGNQRRSAREWVECERGRPEGRIIDCKRKRKEKMKETHTKEAACSQPALALSAHGRDLQMTTSLLWGLQTNPDSVGQTVSPGKQDSPAPLPSPHHFAVNFGK